MNKEAINYKKSIFGILCAAKGNLPESQFHEICRSVITDMVQLGAARALELIGEENEGLIKENRELKEHLADMKGFFVDNNSPL